MKWIPPGGRKNQHTVSEKNLAKILCIFNQYSLGMPLDWHICQTSFYIFGSFTKHEILPSITCHFW